ncbi:MAG: hypothetical protein H6727_08410 [Myxococcales bacterium]|nr:hypothetical protein [Myxococcales bacterium]
MFRWSGFVLCGLFLLSVLRCAPVLVEEPSRELQVIRSETSRTDAAIEEPLSQETSPSEQVLFEQTPSPETNPEPLPQEIPSPTESTIDTDLPDQSVVSDEVQHETSQPEPQTETTPNPESTKELSPEPKPSCLSSNGTDLCDDGSPCNGVERCNTTTGKCVAGKAIVCDDGDDCNGTERCNTKTGACQSAPAITCPIAPNECNQSGGAGTVTANKINTYTQNQAFRLRDQNKWNTYNQIIDQIAAHPSATKVTLTTLLGDLNRTGNKVNSISGVSCLTRGYTWNSGDNGVAYWYPQGLAGSATATSNGQISGKRVLVASWYHKPEADSSTSTNKGVRVSFVDITNTATWPYRHALLVEPVMQGGKASYQPIPIHAGGLAWYKNWLYVPDTSRGLRVFDLDRILRVQTSDSNAVGYIASNDQYHGFGYKYVIPQVNLYTRCSGSCCARFSFAFLAASTQSPSILSGEYTNANVRGRLHRWALDPNTGKLVTKNRTAVATQILFPGVLKMQGAGISGQRIWISSSQSKASSPTSPGSLYTGQIGGSISTYRYPYPPEDMHYSSSQSLLWSQTENPNSRYIFAITPSKIGSACP